MHINSCTARGSNHSNVKTQNTVFKNLTADCRSGQNTRIVRKRSLIRLPHSAHICVNEHICLYWAWVFQCIICMFLQKKEVYIYPLSRIHNTSLISAYIGLDSRECKCLEFFFKIQRYRLNTLISIIVRFIIMMTVFLIVQYFVSQRTLAQ
jgi:hypothetical protein